jgi:hypothetical protein
MTPKPTPTAPELTPAELASLARWHRSKAGALRAYAMPRRSGQNHKYRSLQTAPETVPTACWSVDKNPKGQTWHAVSVSPRYPAAMPPGKAQMQRNRRLAAGRALIRHECAHIAHTAPDYKETLLPLMRRANIPFSVWNLHEDARIETLTAAVTGEGWNWSQHLAPPPDQTTDPAALLYSLIYHEGRHWSAWMGSGDDLQWIRDHYARTTDSAQTPNSAHSLARALEFCQRYKLEAITYHPPHAPTPPDGLPDPDHIPEPAPDAAEVIGRAPGLPTGTPSARPGTPAPTGTAPTDPTGAPAPEHCAGGTPEGIHTQILRDLPGAFIAFSRSPTCPQASLGDAKRTGAELAAMARRAAWSPTQTGQSGTRIHAPGVAVGAEAAFRRSAPDKGPRRLCLIVDMSGSMGMTFRNHAAAFVAAALELNRSRALAVDVWFSQAGTAAKLPAHTRPEALANLAARSGSEGLSNCMRAAAADMAAASAVVVYTDGELGDDKLPRRIRGQDIIGAVCTSSTNAPRMQGNLKAHFDRALVATTPHQLAREIVRYVLTRPV